MGQYEQIWDEDVTRQPGLGAENKALMVTV